MRMFFVIRGQIPMLPCNTMVAVGDLAGVSVQRWAAFNGFSRCDVGNGQVGGCVFVDVHCYPCFLLDEMLAVGDLEPVNLCDGQLALLAS